MIIKLILIEIRNTIMIMKVDESALISEPLQAQARALGERLARLRRARRLRQADAATRAGMSRVTAGRVERGDPRQSLGQILRYLDAIAPGTDLLALLQASDPSLLALESAEATRRVRVMTPRQLDELDF
jgi:transcriptional regulator with XRE-family HTH domain